MTFAILKWLFQNDANQRFNAIGSYQEFRSYRRQTVVDLLTHRLATVATEIFTSSVRLIRLESRLNGCN